MDFGYNISSESKACTSYASANKSDIIKIGDLVSVRNHMGKRGL